MNNNLNLSEKQLDLFFKKVEKTDYCWIWTACKTYVQVGPRKGQPLYGLFGIKGKNKLAHRISYEIFKGQIPDGMCVCHMCNNPSCVNPDHLFLGTYKENTDDMMQKGRGKGQFLNGEDHVGSKLTIEQVKEIKEAFKNNPKRRSGLGKYFAEKFNVNHKTISKIKNGLDWSWLELQ